MSNALPARDQSMDEILASIRRIIETGDERLARNATALDAAARSPTAPSAARSHQDPVSSGRPMPDMASQSDEIAAARLRSEYLAAGSDAAAADHSAFPSAVSEASRVSANAPRSIRRPAVDVAGDPPEWPQAIAANDRYVEVAAEMFVDEFDEAGFADELLKGALAGEEPAAPTASDAAADTSLDMREFDAELDRARLAGFDLPGADSADPALDDGMRVAHALISRESGERVAASFSELAAAIRDEHLRDADQVVREVMRPMLQEWLDENLPRLVEQLVREEIERVARGGTR